LFLVLIGTFGQTFNPDWPEVGQIRAK